MFTEVLPDKRTQVIAGKYCIQYSFGALASGTAVPLIESIGVGPSSTIGMSFQRNQPAYLTNTGAILVLFAGSLTLLTAKWSEAIQHWMSKRPSRPSTEIFYHRKWHVSASTFSNNV